MFSRRSRQDTNHQRLAGGFDFDLYLEYWIILNTHQNLMWGLFFTFWRIEKMNKNFFAMVINSVNVVGVWTEYCDKCGKDVLHTHWRYRGRIAMQCYYCDKLSEKNLMRTKNINFFYSFLSEGG